MAINIVKKIKTNKNYKSIQINDEGLSLFLVLEQYSWTAKAKEMGGQIEEAQNLILQKRIQETAERNAARDKASK